MTLSVLGSLFSEGNGLQRGLYLFHWTNLTRVTLSPIKEFHQKEKKMMMKYLMMKYFLNQETSSRIAICTDKKKTKRNSIQGYYIKAVSLMNKTHGLSNFNIHEVSYVVQITCKLLSKGKLNRIVILFN